MQRKSKGLKLIVLSGLAISLLFFCWYGFVFSQGDPSSPAPPLSGTNFQVCTGSVAQDACYTEDSSITRLNWNYSSPIDPVTGSGGYGQMAFWIQVDNNGNLNDGSFPSPEIDTGWIISSNQYYDILPGFLNPNTTYSWKVAVADANGSWSGWTCADTSFTTVSVCALSVVLSANPSSDYAPLNDVDLTATVTSNIPGTINYIFYCNRSDPGTNITSGWTAKYDGITDNSKTAVDVCDYSTFGTYTAKVIVEQGSMAAEDRETISVFNNPPTASNLQVVKGDYSTNPAHYFSWIYTDPEGSNESKFQFQVDNDSDFSSPKIDRTVTGVWSSGDSNNQIVVVAVSPGLDQIGYNTPYYWRVTVWDASGSSFGWVQYNDPADADDDGNSSTFTTELHRYPSSDFNWAPQQPSQEEDVLFADQSTCYDINNNPTACVGWSWTFEDGNPVSSNAQNPIIQFTSDGSKQVTLQVTDSDNFSCQISKSVGVQAELPGWQEILPQ